MMDEITKGVREAFAFLCETPHGSGNEAALCGRLADRLRRDGYAPDCDEKGNLYCDLPASDGCADAPRVLLQAHLDMVCAVGSPDYHPETDPIRPIERDGWLCTAGESSLGADCGAGLAVMLWLAEHPAPGRPPIRLICTVEEEIGLLGAREIPAERLADAAYLINLDGFRFGRMVVGAAGGLREHFTRPCPSAPAPETPNGAAYRLTFSGFAGGHSGFDIGKKRANAVLLMGELLRELRMEVPFALVSFAGGTAFNAIPYTCTAELVTIAPARDVIESLADKLCARYAETEPEGRLTVEEIARPAQVMDGGAASGLLTALGGFVDGVYALHPETGAVADSSNLGHVYQADGQLCLDAMIRCVDGQAEQALHQSHQLVCGMCGFTGQITSRYSAWPAEGDSKLVSLLAQAYRARVGQEPEISVQHVGLEPSFLREKNPNLQCVCIGMELADCHSPQERWKLDTVAPFVSMLSDTLTALGADSAE